MKSIFIKIAFIVLAFITISIQSNAQVAGINYQAVAIDEKGKEIPGVDMDGRIVNNPISVKFTILKGNTSNILYQEIHFTRTDAYGMFSLIIGKGSSTSLGSVNSIDNIDWSTQDQFLKVELDFKGTGEFKLMGVQQLMAVPFAYYSLNSGNKQSLSLTGNQLSISEGNTINLPTYNAGNGISISGNTITNNAPNQVQILSISNDTIYLSGGGYAKLPAGYSGNYNDLTNKPVLFDGAYSSLTGKPSLFDGVYSSLNNKPNIKDSISTYGFNGNYNNLSNKPTLFNGAYSSLTGTPTLSTVATSGNYSDLSNLPNIKDSINTYSFNGAYSSLTGTPILSTVATSGNYADLSNKPSIKDSITTYGFNGNYPDLTNKPNIKDSINTYIDGTETKITAGTNTTITGDGSVASPYVVNASGSANTGAHMEVFTSSTNFIVPNGVTSVIVEVIGGGAGGCRSSSNLAGASGKIGGYGKGSISVIPGNSYNITVGAGGAGASCYDCCGATGGDTSFDGIVTATGGSSTTAGTSNAIIKTAATYYGAGGGGGGTDYRFVAGKGGKGILIIYY